MLDVEVQTFINVLIDQRNSALNKLAEVTANNFSLNKELQELQNPKKEKECPQ
jgi:hypothetical protein